MKLFDLNGKAILITGASGGIGQAVVNQFCERGSKLVLTISPQKAFIVPSLH